MSDNILDMCNHKRAIEINGGYWYCINCKKRLRRINPYLFIETREISPLLKWGNNV